MADRRVLEIMPIWRGTGSSNPFRSSGESGELCYIAPPARSDQSSAGKHGDDLFDHGIRELQLEAQ
jgi:hypothetical protein